MYKELKLVRISEEYIKFLSQVDNKVPYNSKNKKGRPFIGILFKLNKIQYFAPLSSPKEKHKKIPNNVDFIKIYHGKYGVINLNNMIPILKEEIIEIDFNSITNKNYKLLLENQIEWCNINKETIKTRAKNLRKSYEDETLPLRIKDRCCNFCLLEKQLEKYLEKEKKKDKNMDFSL